MNYSYDYGIMTQGRGPNSFHNDVDERERSTEVWGTTLLGFSFFSDVRSRTSTVIDQTIVVAVKGAKYLFLGCQPVSSSVNLRAQLMMMDL